jgi:predicted dehydrogenase
VIRLEFNNLLAFWVTAAKPQPVLILGAGRWGRTLTKVAASAIPFPTPLVLVARSNYLDTRAWQAENAQLAHVTVYSNFQDALATLGRNKAEPVAIVASRPSSHLKDALACIDAGLHTLVENPLASNAVDAAAMLQHGNASNRVLALGVEFSLMPAFHYVAPYLGEQYTRLVLDWEDPANEIRHGQPKRVHSETHVLSSIGPHAVSIWRIFVGDSQSWQVLEADLRHNGDRGFARLSTDGCELTVYANRAGSRRTRRLGIETKTASAEIDFAGPDAAITLDDQPLEMPNEWALLNSSLRLELGAFFAHAHGEAALTPITHRLSDYVQIQSAVDDKVEHSSK